MKTFQILLERIVSIQEGFYKNNRRISSLMSRLNKEFSVDNIIQAAQVFQTHGGMNASLHPLHDSSHPMHDTFKNLMTASDAKMKRNMDLESKGLATDIFTRSEVSKDPMNVPLRNLRRVAQKKTSSEIKAQKKGLFRGSAYLPSSGEYLRYTDSRLSDQGRN